MFEAGNDTSCTPIDIDGHSESIALILDCISSALPTKLPHDPATLVQLETLDFVRRFEMTRLHQVLLDWIYANEYPSASSWWRILAAASRRRDGGLCSTLLTNLHRSVLAPEEGFMGFKNEDFWMYIDLLPDLNRARLIAALFGKEPTEKRKLFFHIVLPNRLPTFAHTPKWIGTFIEDAMHLSEKQATGRTITVIEEPPTKRARLEAHDVHW